MSDYDGMAAPFGYYCFTYISGSIEIEMRTVAYQYFGPVCLRKSGIFPRSKLKISVSAEMDERVGIKLSLHIKIGRDIRVGRDYINPMNQFK